MYKEIYNTDDLSNVSEEVFFEELHAAITEKRFDFCQCEVCIQDIAAIVLNKIPTKYECSFLEKVSPHEHTLQQLNTIRQQIIEELPQAIEMVTKHSHH